MNTVQYATCLCKVYNIIFRYALHHEYICTIYIVHCTLYYLNYSQCMHFTMHNTCTMYTVHYSVYGATANKAYLNICTVNNSTRNKFVIKKEILTRLCIINCVNKYRWANIVYLPPLQQRSTRYLLTLFSHHYLLTYTIYSPNITPLSTTLQPLFHKEKYPIHHSP